MASQIEAAHQSRYSSFWLYEPIVSASFATRTFSRRHYHAHPNCPKGRIACHAVFMQSRRRIPRRPYRPCIRAAAAFLLFRLTETILHRPQEELRFRKQLGDPASGIPHPQCQCTKHGGLSLKSAKLASVARNRRQSLFQNFVEPFINLLPLLFFLRAVHRLR